LKASLKGRQQAPAASNEQEIWVDMTTGQPSQPWLPNAMPTHRKFIPQEGKIETGPGVAEQEAVALANAKTPQAAEALMNTQQRWGLERAEAEAQAKKAAASNPGRG
jgi:hypothetical protein